MKTLHILNESRYSKPAHREVQSVEQDLIDFLGDCNDMTFEDRLSVSVDKAEVLHLFYQVYENQHDDLGLELWLEKFDGGSHPSFLTIHLHRPSEAEPLQEKLNSVKASAEKMREGFTKSSSGQVEAGLKTIEALSI